MKKLQPLLANIPDTFGQGGANLSPKGNGSPALVDVLQEFNAQVAPQAAPPAAIASGAIDPDVPFQKLSITGTVAFTLADGTTEGQRVTLAVIVAASTPDGTITPTTFADGSTINFQGFGSIVLEWHASGGWHTILNASGTIA